MCVGGGGGWKTQEAHIYVYFGLIAQTEDFK